MEKSIKKYKNRKRNVERAKAVQLSDHTVHQFPFVFLFPPYFPDIFIFFSSLLLSIFLYTIQYLCVQFLLLRKQLLKLWVTLHFSSRSDNFLRQTGGTVYKYYIYFGSKFYVQYLPNLKYFWVIVRPFILCNYKLLTNA